MTTDQAIILAYQHLHDGRLSQTEALCRQVLAVQPDHPRALHLLGALAYQAGQIDQAIDLVRRAIALAPEEPDFHTALGTAYGGLGRFDQAVAEHQKAVALDPNHSEAHYNLGVALAQQRRLDEAIGQFRRTIELVPDHAIAHNNLGLLLSRTGRGDEAIGHYRKAIELVPGNVMAYNNLAGVLTECWRLDEALALCQQAIALLPADRQPDNAPGSVPTNRDQLEATRALHSTLGHVLGSLGRLTEAASAYEHALRLDPADPSVHYCYAHTLLQAGDYKRGWFEHEWRLGHPRFPPRPFKQPKWDGSSFVGRTILLHAEQGLGDAIQFIRYAPLVKARGGTVILECPSMLASILATCPGIDRIVIQDQPLPEFDIHLPLMSAPFVFETTLSSIPATMPYLRSDPERVRHWQSVVAGRAEGRLKVGICWQGNPQMPTDRFRSVPLEQFTPLAKVTGIRLFSLQRGPGTEQLDQWSQRSGIVELVARTATGPEDWMDTAAIMQSMDLVISVCTANAHVAGALGVPLWLLLGASADSRWLADRSDTPWYPTARLFRHKSVRDWEPFFEEVARNLAALSCSNPPPRIASAASLEDQA